MNMQTETNIPEAFPQDPEQWIYNKAREYEIKLPVKLEAPYTTEERTIALLRHEVKCLKLALRDFNNLYKKFKENQK